MAFAPPPPESTMSLSEPNEQELEGLLWSNEEFYEYLPPRTTENEFEGKPFDFDWEL
jgi:hypothetical protein